MPLTHRLTLSGIAADSMISKTTQRLGKDGVVRRDYPTFAGSQMLHRVKTENGHMRNRADATPTILRTQGVTSVLDHNQAVALSQFQDRIQIRGVTGIIDRKYCFCACVHLS